MQRQQVTGRQSLEAARGQFEAWRSQRKRGAKRPQGLWQLAVELSNQHSVGEIARVLGLHYGRLKQRIHNSKAGSRRPIVKDMEFVTVGALPTRAPARATMGQSTVVELEDGSGKRLKVQLIGAGTDTVIEVAQALWEWIG